MLHLQFFFRSQNILVVRMQTSLALASLHKAWRTGWDVLEMPRGYIASAHIYEYDVAAAKNG